MFICICKAVSDSRIRQAAANGVRSLRELQEVTGLGTRCGKCVSQARALLDEAPAATAGSARPRMARRAAANSGHTPIRIDRISG